ncbi:hypothetical protein [Kribbella solani]|uniref:hypothetical protein n=1 Tax=Kribbella solani TaxID=236067 RepID=UPI0029BC67E0|nr:hypothetical protein [Kribbella solani]MDX2970770.1 hypothetical protein [Kribbella solani]
MLITAASFPTPDLIKVTNNPGQWDQQEGFARFQAEAANGSVAWLGERLGAVATRAERSMAFAQLYRNLAEWRFETAHRAGGRSPNSELEQYHQSIGPHEPRTSVFGPRLRSEGGGQLDFSTRRLTDGIPTPASRQSALIGTIIEARFAARRTVWCCRTRSTFRTNGVSTGTCCSVDWPWPTSVGSRFAIDELYATKTAEHTDRWTLQAEAFGLLADLEERRSAGQAPDAEARRAFVQATYYLYQGPEFVRGGDATIRTLLVAAHARVFDEALKVMQDVDIRAMTMSQRDFTKYAVQNYALAGPSGPAATAQQTAAHRPQERANGLERG